MNKSIQIFRVNDAGKTFHMTRSEIEKSNNNSFRVLTLLGYCPKCDNFSTESEIDNNNIVCVLCGHKRKFAN